MLCLSKKTSFELAASPTKKIEMENSTLHRVTYIEKGPELWERETIKGRLLIWIREKILLSLPNFLCSSVNWKVIYVIHNGSPWRLICHVWKWEKSLKKIKYKCHIEISIYLFFTYYNFFTTSQSLVFFLSLVKGSVKMAWRYIDFPLNNFNFSKKKKDQNFKIAGAFLWAWLSLYNLFSPFLWLWY